MWIIPRTVAGPLRQYCTGVLPMSCPRGSLEGPGNARSYPAAIKPTGLRNYLFVTYVTRLHGASVEAQEIPDFTVTFNRVWITPSCRCCDLTIPYHIVIGRGAFPFAKRASACGRHKHAHIHVVRRQVVIRRVTCFQYTNGRAGFGQQLPGEFDTDSFLASPGSWWPGIIPYRFLSIVYGVGGWTNIHRESTRLKVINRQTMPVRIERNLRYQGGKRVGQRNLYS